MINLRANRIVSLSVGACGLVLSLLVACGSDSDAGASSGGNNTSGGFGDRDGGDDNGLAGCNGTSKKAETVPVDIGLALDTSFSMDFDQKWINTKAALKAFVKNPAYGDLSLALQFYPVRKQCSIAEYANPAVPMGLLPSVADPVATALDAQSMELGTPMVQVLQGMTDYLRTHAQANPSRKPILLLASDGLPDESCKAPEEGTLPNSLANAVATVDAAFKATPSIPTFVIGVGTELSALNQIAAAGGTGDAILIDPTKNVQEAFLAALETIRKTAIPCDYPIPPSTGPVRGNEVNVTYNASDGTTIVFGFVGTADGCAKAEETGYYFDNESAPTRVFLCPKTCERVKGDAQGEVNVVFGCARNDVR